MRFSLLLIFATLSSACDRGLSVPPGPIINEPLGYCAPSPVTRATELAPDLRAWILAAEQGSCYLTGRTSAGVTDGFPGTHDTFPAPGTSSCEADGCWIELPAFARAWTHMPAPKPYAASHFSGEKWAGMVRAARNQTTGALRATLIAMQFGSSAVQRYERRFDAEGHLLKDQQYFNNALWFTTTNTWDGDHLVASQFIDSINGTGQTDYAFTFTAAYLQSATATHLGHVQTAKLTYERGRVVSAVRTIDGQPRSTQTWTFTDGRLARNSTELVLATADGSLEPDGTLQPDGDDLEPLLIASTQPQWNAARPAPTAGCTPLPHSLYYGYPTADEVYGLGWPVGDRPIGIDADYGFGPAYDSGMDRWYGHDRVEGIHFQLPSLGSSAKSVHVDLDYDVRGRMVSEKLSSSDISVASIRTRTFDGDSVAPRTDTRAFTRDGHTLTTALTFTFDNGRLAVRTYTMNGVLVGQHTSSYRDGQLFQNAIVTQPIHSGVGQDDSALEPDNLHTLGDLPAPIVHQRAISDAGATVTLLRNEEVTEVRTRDSDQRVVSRLSSRSKSEERFSYQPSGELLSYSTSWSVNMPPDLLLSYQVTSDNRLVSRHWVYTSTADTDDFAYFCR